MIKENIAIKLESRTQEKNVISTLERIGVPKSGNSYRLFDNTTYIRVVDGQYFKIDWEADRECKKITFEQFMEKYEMSNLKKKIEDAKKTTGLSASALSEKLGFQHKYLTNAVREASTQRQKEIIAKLDGLIFKEENELTHDFEGKALNVNIDDAVMVSKDEYSEMYSNNTALCVEVGHLKKELNHKNQVLDKRNDLYRKLELECKDKDEAIKLQLENVASKILAINELESQLKTTQQKFIDVVDQKDSDIKKLQKDCNHATNQYHGKCNEVARLKSKFKNQTDIYFIIIVIISLIGIMGFAS